MVRAYSALKTLREETQDDLPVRSRYHVDHSTREAGSSAPDLPRPAVTRLPRLIVGTRLVLRDDPLEWLALPTGPPGLPGACPAC